MSEWTIEPAGGPLGGRVSAPGDKSIGHRALLFSALSRERCRITGLSGGADNRATAGALAALGVDVSVSADGRAAEVEGVGLDGLVAPSGPIDCGNSGTSMRLLAGLLAAQPFEATLVGDASLSQRPMRRVADPLAKMGARIEGRPNGKGDITPPLVVCGGRLAGIVVESPIASAQVKSALLLAGLYADGVTEVREPGPSRDHTERMLAKMGAPITRPGPNVARVDPEGWDRVLRGGDVDVPGDPSSAAFLVVAALLCGATEVRVENVCVNPTRTGFLDALRAMGAVVEETNPREAAGEPVADLVVRGRSSLRAVTLEGDLVVRAIDEIPILAVAAARAKGTTVVRDAAELRVKESDRVASTVALLGAFGVPVEERPDGLVIHGDPDRPLVPATVHSRGDHRIAMSAAVLALLAPAPSRIQDTTHVATSFPRFLPTLATLRQATLRSG